MLARREAELAILSLFGEADEDPSDHVWDLVAVLRDLGQPPHTDDMLHFVRGRMQYLINHFGSLFQGALTEDKLPLVCGLVGECLVLSGDRRGAISWLTHSLAYISQGLRRKYEGVPARSDPAADPRDLLVRNSRAAGSLRQPPGWELRLSWWAANVLDLRGKARASIADVNQVRGACEDYAAALALLAEGEHPEISAYQDHPPTVLLSIETYVDAAYAHLRSAVLLSQFAGKNEEVAEELKRAADYYREGQRLQRRFSDRLVADASFRRAWHSNSYTRRRTPELPSDIWKVIALEAIIEYVKPIVEGAVTYLTLESALWEALIRRASDDGRAGEDDNIVEFLCDLLLFGSRERSHEGLRKLLAEMIQRNRDCSWVMADIATAVKHRRDIWAGLGDLASQLRQHRRAEARMLGQRLLVELTRSELDSLRERRDTTEETQRLLKRLLRHIEEIVQADPDATASKEIVTILATHSGWIASVAPDLRATLYEIVGEPHEC